ncbi:expressed unknown protein [Seminavis robusta]|uniref:Uncharacterized protein n=1 Tax=Seminavis robusta TaxID=568900 RepID=A0A9N8ET57_9STRA|nr:expressed unknown protein [Seminavis robusta]|eukprot:Sro1625_g286770.1 n/a (852) ;mRNA; r:13338-15999
MTDSSSPKRRKVEKNDFSVLLEDWLGVGGAASEPPQALQALLGPKVRRDLHKLQQLFQAAGFRTSIVQSPRLAVSLYKDSCVQVQQQQQLQQQQQDDNKLYAQKDYLLTMLGLHPDQTQREDYYQQHFQPSYCLHRFVARLQVACRKAMKDPHVEEWMASSLKATTCTTTANQTANADHHQAIPKLIQLLLKADPRLRQEQLEHELERVQWHHCTLANALVQQFLRDYHGCVIQNVFFKTSHVPKYERITFYLYDPQIDLVKPSNFMFLPDLSRALQQQQQPNGKNNNSASTTTTKEPGTQAIVQDMMATFWSHLLRHGGYYASATMKKQLSPALHRYFLSGLRQDPNIPLKLNAHFEPCQPISLYLWGKAGAGKSSFVRHVPAAIQAAVEAHADPEMLVRFVKQALNKPYQDLCLELDLRPNNNDLSVMSIIQSRKCTMTQSKPGLVVIDLEEMPQYHDDDDDNTQQHDPHQLQVCQLVAQRFGGRKGEYSSEKKAPRNSEKRGIGNDASLITLFTSNYELMEPAREALQRLPMFQHLTAVEMTAIEGSDRREFALAYFQQSIQDRIQQHQAVSTVLIKALNIPLGEGDTRPLVRHLRMLAYYVSAVILGANGGGLQIANGRICAEHQVSVTQNDKSCQVVVGDKPALDLHVGTLDNLFPVKEQIFDPRTERVRKELQSRQTKLSDSSLSELSTILDFWLGGALAPAVILSQQKDIVDTLIDVIGKTLGTDDDDRGVQCLANIEAGEYKMMKSLYDPRDTPNLRDDILKLGGGRRTVGGVGSNTALVALGIQCPSTDAQLCIREMLEDSPSMTAFSSDKSALYKSGLVFAVYIEGDEITPELRSRASLVL